MMLKTQKSYDMALTELTEQYILAQKIKVSLGFEYDTSKIRGKTLTAIDTAINKFDESYDACKTLKTDIHQIKGLRKDFAEIFDQGISSKIYGNLLDMCEQLDKNVTPITVQFLNDQISNKVAVLTKENIKLFDLCLEYDELAKDFSSNQKGNEDLSDKLQNIKTQVNDLIPKPSLLDRFVSSVKNLFGIKEPKPLNLEIAKDLQKTVDKALEMKIPEQKQRSSLSEVSPTKFTDMVKNDRAKVTETERSR